MVFVKKYTKKAYKRRPTVAKKSYKKRMPTAKVAKVVKQVLARQVEVKQCGNNPALYSWNANNGSMSVPIDLGGCFSNVTQGVTDGTRIGTKIFVKKAVLNLNIMTNQANLITGPIPSIVTIFIGYQKGQRSVQPGSTELAGIFNDGPSSDGMTGLTLDLLRTINYNRFTVKRYDFKIGVSESGNGQYSNNDFPMYVNRKISLPLLLGNVLYSNDQFNNYNKSLWMFCQWTNVDSSPSTNPPILNWYVDGLYTDM